MVVEDDWTFALELLKGSLEGITDEQALSVLTGSHRLTGVNTLQYVDEDEAGRAAVHEMYAAVFDCRGTLLHNGKRYQVYGYVDSFGIDDAVRPSRVDLLLSDVVWHAEQLKHDEATERALHYAVNPLRDVVLPVRQHDGKLVFALFEPAYDSFPPWLACFRSAQEAFSAAESVVSACGHRSRYPRSVHPEEKSKTTQESLSEKERAAANLAAREKRAAEWTVEVEEIRGKVVAFADADEQYGWNTFSYRDKESGERYTLRAPGRAMAAYALSRTNASHLQPEYAPFSPPDLKLLYDNPLHSDAWLGCGFPLDSTVYDRRDVRVRAFYELAFELQQSLLGYKAHVLTSAGLKSFEGQVVTPDTGFLGQSNVLVVPHAGVEFDLAARSAGAIICEVGGPLAHLVTVARERGVPILRVEDATRLYREGLRLRLDFEKGEVLILPAFTAHPPYPV